MKIISTKAAVRNLKVAVKAAKNAKASRSANKAEKAAPVAVKVSKKGNRTERVYNALKGHKKGLDIHELSAALGLPDTNNSHPLKAIRELIAAERIVKTEDRRYVVA